MFFPQPGRSMSFVRPEIDCPKEIVFSSQGSGIRGLSKHGVQLSYPELLQYVVQGSNHEFGGGLRQTCRSIARHQMILLRAVWNLAVRSRH